MTQGHARRALSAKKTKRFISLKDVRANYILAVHESREGDEPFYLPANRLTMLVHAIQLGRVVEYLPSVTDSMELSEAPTVSAYYTKLDPVSVTGQDYRPQRTSGHFQSP